MEAQKHHVLRLAEEVVGLQLFQPLGVIIDGGSYGQTEQSLSRELGNVFPSCPPSYSLLRRYESFLRRQESPNICSKSAATEVASSPFFLPCRGIVTHPLLRIYYYYCSWSHTATLPLPMQSILLGFSGGKGVLI